MRLSNKILSGSNLQFSDSGSQKYLDFIRMGKEQTWDPQEVSAFNSTFPLLSDIKFIPGSLAVSVRSMPDDRVIPLKLLFSRGGTQVVLDYVEFRKVRSGAEEVEIATVGTPPLGITLVLPFNGASEVTATFSTNLPGQMIQQVAKACDAFELLQSGCTLELVSLKLNGHLCTLACDPLPLRFKPRFLKFVKDLSAIAAKFNANFAMPSTLTLPPDEEEAFMLLRAFALNEPLELNRFTPTLIKSPENATIVPQQFRDEIVLRLEHENSTAVLFGTTIRLGSTKIQMDRVEVLQFSNTMKRFSGAKMGEAVPIPLRPLVPVRFEIVEPKALLSRSSGSNETKGAALS